MFTFQNITKKFGTRTVANQINLSVANGEILTILGASGSGKSTLLHLAAGLLQPDAGDVWLNQERITNRQPEKREIAMMFQDFALLPHLNVWENVALGLRLRGEKKAVARTAALRILVEMGLQHASERTITQLSGGEQQRVALARALVVSPKLLLLDEPFSSLDTALRQHLQHEISQWIQQKNIPAILVSHDPAEAALMSQRIALLENGHIIQCDTPNQLFAQPVSAQAARLLGCLNVRDDVYIPQQAIQFHHEKGSECEILRCFKQPFAWRVEWMQPSFGELVAWVNDDVAQRLGKTARVRIDLSKVIYFK